MDMIGKVPHDAYTVLHRLSRKSLCYSNSCTLVFAHYIVEDLEKFIKKAHLPQEKNAAFKEDPLH